MQDAKSITVNNSDGVANLIIGSSCHLVRLRCLNKHATEVRYIHLKNGAGGTILSTTKLPAAVVETVVALPFGLRFTKGLEFLITTTAEGTTGAPADATTNVEIHYVL